MLTKTITYNDYNGVERTEDYLFNLSKAELMEMELSIAGGLSETIDKIIKTKDTPALVKIFKELLLNSYGVKSPDGKRFIKTDELREEFAHTEAYSKLFMELATNAEAAAAFVNGIIPADLANEAAKNIPEKTQN